MLLIIHKLLFIMQIIVFIYGMYLLTLALFGIRTRMTETSHAPKNRFSILIPAHNEEAVIHKLVQNLKQQKYPKHLYDIFVIADNCSDNTAQIARKNSARVLERFNDVRKGKGYALEWALRQLNLSKGHSHKNRDYDAVVIIDADNLVSDNFLDIMNNRLINGENVIQSYIDSKNPSDTWVTAAFSIMFWLNNRFTLMSRYNTGFSALLAGTGMCISADVLREIGWATSTLTEDLEYSTKALLHNYRTTYAHDARIYDEKPLNFFTSCRQRLRWARGQIDVAIKYLPKMLFQGIKEMSIVKIESALRLCQLFIIVFAGIILVTSLVQPQWVAITSIYLHMQSHIPFLGFTLPYMPYIVPIILLSLDHPPLKPFRYLLLFPIFAYSWYIIYFYALFTYKNNSWMPTKHTRDLDLNHVKSEFYGQG